MDPLELGMQTGMQIGRQVAGRTRGWNGYWIYPSENENSLREQAIVGADQEKKKKDTTRKKIKIQEARS